MKIVEKAIKQIYRFSCPVCGSRLEGESQEFVDIGGKVNKFFFARFAERIVIFPGPALGRILHTRNQRVRNNYNLLYERRASLCLIKMLLKTRFLESED